ncbi:MAG: nuclear transport factor 2 family protein [Acidimicrobiia bacterium]
MDLQAVSDKLEIHELLARYARGVDLKDWELWKSVFTDDAIIDYSSANCPVGPRDEMAAWLEQGLGKAPMTQHFITNIEVDLDGDRASVHAMFYNPMLLPGMADQTYCGGYYHHDVVRTAEGWKSEHLVEENLWMVNSPRDAMSAADAS